MPAEDLARLSTETRNPATLEIDSLDSLGICRLMNDEDARVAGAVRAVLPDVARAVDLAVRSLASGGRLIYVGAGTSGRLGVLDSSECPPTFGVPPDRVVGVIAGGKEALTGTAEGVEDDPAAGARDVEELGLTPIDTVVGIAASGRTPYTLGAIRAARERGCSTVALVCNADSPLGRAADVCIAPVVGPEAILGSTRLKAGTAQKLVLNMLSTAAMVRLGKVYSNLMVDLAPSNEKLVQRGVRIVALATDASLDEARQAFEAAGRQAKVAIVMILAGVSADEARELLKRSGGFVRKALPPR